MSIFKIGTKLSGSIIMSAVLSFFLCISMSVICTALFTDYTGYNAYVYEQDGEKSIAEYQYNYADNNGVDDKKTEYEEQGYTVVTHKVRSTLTGGGKVLFLGATQIFSLVLVVSFAGGSVYKQGSKDLNLVRTGHKNTDILKGFKIGIVANIPFFILFVLMVVLAAGLAPNFLTTWYAFLNCNYYSLILWVAGSAKTISNLTILQYVLLFLIQLIVPVISAVAYVLGFKEINFFEKIVYKKGVK